PTQTSPVSLHDALPILRVGDEQIGIHADRPTRDREVLHGTCRVDAPIGSRGNLHLAEGIAFNAKRTGVRTRWCLLTHISRRLREDRKSTRLNSSHVKIS